LSQQLAMTTATTAAGSTDSDGSDAATTTARKPATSIEAQARSSKACRKAAH